MPAIETISRHGLTCDIRSDETYFTVWQGDRPVGTIFRPTRDQPKWRAYATDGSLIKSTIGPRTAFNAIAYHARRA